MQQAPEFSDFLQNLFIILTLKYAKLKKKKSAYMALFFMDTVHVYWKEMNSKFTLQDTFFVAPKILISTLFKCFLKMKWRPFLDPY